ncbi:hypothetical protein F5B21DRAFT_524704 [Xylaria acuta]|nr:hypothetical protein F5B21DRAFT_524704 [Xylaria acuta]
MASIGRIAVSGLNTILESTQTLANLQFDFSIVRVEAPREFHDLGQCLIPARRETAEDGKLHITARRLGAIFDSIVPQTPQLIKSYGLRVSEIARESMQSSPKSLGIFAKQAGVDGASIWAGATSGSGAVQVHLLACMLARMWNGSEATSIWVELLKCRRTEIQAEFDRTGSIDTRTLVASKQQIDRSDLAEWDASARAWLRVADHCKSLQQKQLLLIIGNLDRQVNSKASVYDSVLKAWTTGLEVMESLLQGCPMIMQSGDIPLALSSWHIYPDLNLLDPATKLVHQKDPLVPEPGILTIGLNWHGNADDKGLQWSLPLAHLRYYGDPVVRTSKITTQGSRLSLDEFSMAVLGCVLGGWDIGDEETEKIVLLFCNTHGRAVKDSWLYLLGCAAELFMHSHGFERRLFTQLMTLGRNHHSFLGAKPLPFFGLSDINRALSIAKTTEQKIGILRSHAVSTGMEWDHCIIRYTSDETKRQEYATAVPFSRDNRERTSSKNVKPGVGHTRWICSRATYSQQEYEDRDELDIIHNDVFVGSMDGFDPEKRYDKMGEEVLHSEAEHLQSITRADQGTRVIWGITELNPHAPWGWWDHWFGPMRHYEYWLGDTESTAIYIRMDQAKPDGQAHIHFSELETLFEDGRFNNNRLFNALDEACQSLDQSYMASLQAFASLYSLYRALTQSSIDVRILSQPLALTQWFRSLFDSGSIIGRPLGLSQEEMDDELENNFIFIDGDVTRMTPGERCFMDAVKAMEVPVMQSESSRKPFASGEESIPKVLNFLKSRIMSTEQSFSCILLCENSFDITPIRLKNVMALSSGNSLFVDASLTCDPTIPPGRIKIRHVMGNIGKPGAALLVPPIEPGMMTLGIERWHLINFSAWDGQARDCFADSSLHIWFTGFTQEVDIGYSGAQDRELYIVESVVSLYAKAEWIADLDILKAIQSPSLIYRHIQTLPVKDRQVVQYKNKPRRALTSPPLVVCEDDHKNEYQYEEMPLVAVENWTELLTDTPKSCVFLANRNWQARLAAMMICISQGRKVCLLSDNVCWDCVNLTKKSPSSSGGPTVYIH